MIRGCGVKLGGRRVKFGIGSLKAGLGRFRLPDGFLRCFVCRIAPYKIAHFPCKPFYSANFADIVSVIVLLARFQAALWESGRANGYNSQPFERKEKA